METIISINKSISIWLFSILGKIFRRENSEISIPSFRVLCRNYRMQVIVEVLDELDRSHWERINASKNIRLQVTYFHIEKQK